MLSTETPERSAPIGAPPSNHQRSDVLDVDGLSPAVEIRVLWGDSQTLHVAHLSPPRAFTVGDACDGRGRSTTDFLIGSEHLGDDCLPITADTGAGVGAVVPEDAAVELWPASGAPVSMLELQAQGRLLPFAERRRARLLPLGEGEVARVAHRGFTFVVSPVRSARRVGAPRPHFDWRAHRWTLAAMGLHGFMLLLFQLLPPSSSALTLHDLSREERLVAIQIDALERYAPPLEPMPPGDDGAPEAEAAPDARGDMGEPGKPDTGKRSANRGPQDNPEPAVPKVTSEMAATAGIIGILQASAAVSQGPSNPFAADNARGADASDALGNLFGAQIGASGGFGGLHMLGTGRGGGGEPGGRTVGTGRLRTRGASGPGGHGITMGDRAREPRVPPPPSTQIALRGSISKEAIRRTIRRHVAEVRYCYEQGLQRRPDLQGRVAVKFMVSGDGSVRAAAVQKSSVGERRVEQCITSAVRRWTFPQPSDGGVVMVTYPFVLRQTGG